MATQPPIKQERLLTLIGEAMTDIETSPGYLASVEQVQAWLAEHYQLEVSLEDVKRNGDIVREVRRREEQEIARPSEAKMFEPLPDRTQKQVRPRELVNEILDAMSRVGFGGIGQEALVTVKVSFVPLTESEPPFVRYFPDMDAWERIKLHLTYASIEVERVHGVIKPNGQFEESE